MKVVVAAACCVCLALGALVGLVATRRGGSRTSDPSKAATVLLPPPSGKASKSDALTGPAALVETFRTLSAPLLTITSSMLEPDRYVLCQNVATKLDAAVDPSALAQAALSIPDQTLSETALSERTARGDLLIACGHHDIAATDRLLLTVEAVDTVFTRRLAQL